MNPLQNFICLTFYVVRQSNIFCRLFIRCRVVHIHVHKEPSKLYKTHQQHHNPSTHGTPPRSRLFQVHFFPRVLRPWILLRMHLHHSFQHSWMKIFQCSTQLRQSLQLHLCILSPLTQTNRCPQFPASEPWPETNPGQGNHCFRPPRQFSPPSYCCSLQSEWYGTW